MPTRHITRRRVYLPALLATLVFSIAASASGGATAVYQVPASVAADCSVDVTPALLGWFSSVPNGSVLSFGAGGCYRIEGTLELRGRSGLDFEGNGATFRSFNAPDDQRAIWRLVDSSGIVFNNLTIIGSYAVVAANPDHGNSAEGRDHGPDQCHRPGGTATSGISFRVIWWWYWEPQAA
jgi:hypothetical protein